MNKDPIPGVVVTRREACATANEAYKKRYGNYPNHPADLGARPMRGFAAGNQDEGVAEYAENVQIADFNKDGAPDIALVLKKSDAVAVVLAIGKQFGPAVNFATGKGPSVLEAGDLNGDGVLDLVTANEGIASGADLSGGDVSLLVGKGDGTFATAMSIDGGKVPRDVGLGDFNRDGKLDLSVANAPFTDARSILIRLGNGDGTFRAAEAIAEPALESLTIIDFNPDIDDVDDIVTNGSVLLGRGDGTFAPAVALPLGFSTTLNRVAVGDLNADGKPDVVTGGFAPRPGIPAGTLCNDAFAADFNGDAKADLVLADGGGFLTLDGSVKLALGNGDGTFGALRPLRENIRADRIATGDFNHDQKLDLAVSLEASQFDWDVEILLGQGDGSFAGARALGLSDDLISGVVAADVDLDGQLDLGVNVGSEEALALRGNGDGTFEPALRGPLPGYRMVVTDLDRDGWPDIVAPSNVGFVAVLRNAASETGLVRPALKFLLSALGLELSWPGTFEHFALKQTDSLSSPTDWRAATNAVTSGNGQFRVVVDPTAGKRFFRLETAH